MLDIKFIRENAELVKKAVIDKQLSQTVDIDRLLEVDKTIRDYKIQIENLRQKRNALSEKKSTVQGAPQAEVIEEGKAIRNKIRELEDTLKPLAEEFSTLMMWVPNPPAHDVPIGKDESQNVEIKKEGTPPTFHFTPLDHSTIGEKLGIIDITRGAKIGGFRSYFLVGKGAILEQAILRFAMDHMLSLGFKPLNVPIMVNKEWLFGTGYFPWGKEDHYQTQDDQGLAGTAEVSLTAYHAGEILNEEDLPIKLVGQSPCFRREVGSHGKDTKGVFRVHYFNKVEQVVLLPSDESLSREWHDRMLGYSEDILRALKLPYHVLLMCTGDMGAGQRKKYDIETWFPAQNKYRETHSDSYFLDFQSRRLNMRYKSKTGEVLYIHTLNNTVVATPRLLAAIIENYQQKDGSVVVPEVLRKYTGFESIYVTKG